MKSSNIRRQHCRQHLGTLLDRHGLLLLGTLSFLTLVSLAFIA